MLTLINTNRMVPPIAPVGLDYIAATARRAGIAVELVDLGLAKDPDQTLLRHFSQHRPDLVGLSFRNVDDCFWPSGQSFLPELQKTVASVRRLTDAPLVLGGVGYSIFPRRILAATGADFGIHGQRNPISAATARRRRH